MSRRSRDEPELLKLRERIAQWRAARVGHRMPEELWDSAAAAARRLGVSYVASMLGLGYTALKARAAASLVAVAVPDFVEVRGAQLLEVSAPETVRIELERGETRMIITLPAASAPDVVAAVAALACP